MASLPPHTNDAGYATPAALVLCLALAGVTAAVVVQSTQALRQARADYGKIQVTYALEGAQLAAAAAVVRAGGAGPYRWRFVGPDGVWVDALAEPEAAKVRLDSVARIDAQTFAALGVVDPEDLAARAAAATRAPSFTSVADLDEAPLWKACGPSLLSSLGEQEASAYVAPTSPLVGERPAAWHIGEAWRIRVATPAGWRDDRIVRFTGDARRPAETVLRRLSRINRGDEACETVLAAEGGA